MACFSHKDWKDCYEAGTPKSLYLSTLFLSERARVNPNQPSLAYIMKLGLRVPDYEVERRLWLDRHYEDSYLFDDSLVMEVVPPSAEDQHWGVTYDWQSDNLGAATAPAAFRDINAGAFTLDVPFTRPGSPGIDGKVRLIVSRWR